MNDKIDWTLSREDSNSPRKEVSAKEFLEEYVGTFPAEDTAEMLTKWKTLYHAPFSTDKHGLYIWDAAGNMIAQPRGWGRISTQIADQKEAAEIQIAFCNKMVELLNNWYKP